jgi:hypothetical protein
MMTRNSDCDTSIDVVGGFCDINKKEARRGDKPQNYQAKDENWNVSNEYNSDSGLANVASAHRASCGATLVSSLELLDEAVKVACLVTHTLHDFLCSY